MASPALIRQDRVQGILLSIRNERVVAVCSADTLIGNRVCLNADNFESFILESVEHFVDLLIIFLVGTENLTIEIPKYSRNHAKEED